MNTESGFHQIDRRMEHSYRQGRDKCDCEVEQDLPFNCVTLVIAVAAIAMAAWLSSLAPMGFAP